MDNEPNPFDELDPKLIPFLQAEDEECHLETLLDDALLSLRMSYERKLEPDLWEELRGEVILRLIARLRALKARPGDVPIRCFRAVVAETARRAYADLLRSRSPRRAALKKRICRLLTQPLRRHGLALWTTPTGERLSGFSSWRQQLQNHRLRRNPEYQQLLEQPRAFARVQFPGKDPARLDMTLLLAGLFRGVGGPIELSDLIRAVAEIQEIQDAEPASMTGQEGEDLSEMLVDPRYDVASEVVQREFLSRLWKEIARLPIRQVAALLLHVRDDRGRSGLIHLLALGIASMGEIAAALQTPVEELVALFPKLPLDDRTISGRLGCTRQQVINLRCVARARLSRRTRGFEDKA